MLENNMLGKLRLKTLHTLLKTTKQCYQKFWKIFWSIFFKIHNLQIEAGFLLSEKFQMLLFKMHILLMFVVATRQSSSQIQASSTTGRIMFILQRIIKKNVSVFK